MQAEEIIHQKEWYQLSENERKFLTELAANEQEYNLLKKMLQVSAEETSEVPLLSEKRKLSLDAIANKNKFKSNRLVWYAAASIALIAFSTLLVYNYNSTTRYPASVASRAPVEDLPKTENKVIEENNDTIQTTTGLSYIVSDSKRRLKSNSSGKTINAQTALPFSNERKYIAVNTTINADPRLLLLVTEVY